MLTIDRLSLLFIPNENPYSSSVSVGEHEVLWNFFWCCRARRLTNDATVSFAYIF